MPHAPQVVVLSKNRQMLGIAVKVVVGQHIVEALQATSPAFTFIKGSAKGLGHRKVHQELHLRVVTILIGEILLPVGQFGCLGYPGFTHYGEVGVLCFNPLDPLGHGLLIGVGIGIHAYALETGVLYPPNAVLNHVIAHQFVGHVHVGHTGVEPTLGGQVEIGLGRIGVGHGA